MKHINEIVHKARKPRNSRRSDLIEQIAQAIDTPWENVFENVWHLKDEWGNEILQGILEDILAYSTDKDWRARKCSELIKKSRPIKQ